MFWRVIVALLCAAAAFGKRGAAEHGNDKCPRAWWYVSEAELFYLRHLRSCAACAAGCCTTSSARSLCLVSGLLGDVCAICIELLGDVCAICIEALCLAAYWCFRALSGLIWMCVFALSHLAPLELGACILIGSSVSTVWRSWLALGACSAFALGLAAAGRRCFLWLVVSCIVRTASMLSQHGWVMSPLNIVSMLDGLFVEWGACDATLGRELLLVMVVCAVVTGSWPLCVCGWRLFAAACVLRTVRAVTGLLAVLQSMPTGAFQLEVETGWRNCFAVICLAMILAERHLQGLWRCPLLSGLCMCMFGFGAGCIALACVAPSFPGSAAEHDGGAAEPERANAEEVRSVEDIIAVLAEEGGERAQSIVAAALAVRDARGRGRKDTLRKLAAQWGKILIRRKEGGRWKDRGLDDIQQDIVKALSQATTACMAKGESDGTAKEQEGSATAASSSAGPGASSSAGSASRPRKKNSALLLKVR